ncbi:dispanin subfamily A member 2b-like [Arapaima gigas]
MKLKVKLTHIHKLPEHATPSSSPERILSIFSMERQEFQPEFMPLHGGTFQQQSHTGDVQVTVIPASSPSPSDHIVCSLFNFAYINPCCLGLAALIFSIKARDQKVIGNMEAARSYGKTACCFNSFALALTLILVVSIIVIITMGIMTIPNTFGK